MQILILILPERKRPRTGGSGRNTQRDVEFWGWKGRKRKQSTMLNQDDRGSDIELWGGGREGGRKDQGVSGLVLVD